MILHLLLSSASTLNIQLEYPTNSTTAAVSVTFGNRKVITQPFIDEGQWHAVGVVFSGGQITIYSSANGLELTTG